MRPRLCLAVVLVSAGFVAGQPTEPARLPAAVAVEPPSNFAPGLTPVQFQQPGPTGGEPGGSTEPPAADPNAPKPNVVVPLGQSFVLRPTAFAAALRPDLISIDRPDVLGLSIGDPATINKAKTEAIFTGAKLGFVTVTFYGDVPAAAKDGMAGAVPTQSFLVKVVPDINYLNRLVKARFPTANLNVVAAGDNVLFVDGTADSPNDVIEVERLLKRFFAGVVTNVRVGGVMQVQLEVVFARIDRTALRQLGFNTLYSQRESIFGTQVGNLINVPAAAIPTGSAGTPGAAFNPIGTNTAALNGNVTSFFGVADSAASVFGFIEALKQNKIAKVLANPTLVTASGRAADFLVGGEQPIPNAITLGVPSVTFKPFGTRLTFLPTILGDGKIRLDVVPEVSNVNFANSISVSGGGGQIPQFVVQRLHATVELQAGQTLCLGGLLQTVEDSQVSKIPVLGSIPVVGALFRRVKHQTLETELLIVITPRLFDPLRGCQVPTSFPGQETVSPTDAQLYLKGYIEVGAPGRKLPKLGDGIGPLYGPAPGPANEIYRRVGPDGLFPPAAEKKAEADDKPDALPPPRPDEGKPPAKAAPGDR